MRLLGRICARLLGPPRKEDTDRELDEYNAYFFLLSESTDNPVMRERAHAEHARLLARQWPAL